jgi:uracil phosphoribosyltransferase
MRELTYSLGYEATSSLSLKPINISVPVPVPVTTGTATSGSSVVDHMECQGSKVKEHVALIPILRSGLGMVDAMLELLPNAEIHHIGMYKSPGQSHPELYFNRLPKTCKVDVAYVLDPCIATSSTVMSVISILKKVC